MTRYGFDDVTITLGGTTAVANVTLDIRAGVVTALVGGDGAGKTTLLRCLAGRVAPAHGRVHTAPLHVTGVLAADRPGYGDLTVAENLAFAAQVRGMDRARARERTAVLLDAAGLTDAKERLADQLSGGMRRKLGFALATLHEPDLLLLDEPTTAVDPVSRTDLWRLMAAAARDGTAVMLATTYLDEAEPPPDDATPVDPDLEDAVVMLDRARRQPGPWRRRSDMTLLRTVGVTGRYGEHTAVDRVDLTVDTGEVVGLLGANGAGKTTLVKLILGLLGPSSGTIDLLGGPPSRGARTHVGYLPQNLGLYTDLTVAEQLRFTGRVYGYRPDTTRVPGDAGGAIGSLPLGARRLTAFAAATGHHPELLLLDEPTSGVDPLSRARLWDRVRDHADMGRGVLISTHYLSEAEQCDRLVIMAAGRVVATGQPDQIVAGRHAVAVRTDHWQDAFTALDDASLHVALDGRRLRVIDAPAGRVASLLASAGIAAEAEDVPATLEEVFVELARRPAA